MVLEKMSLENFKMTAIVDTIIINSKSPHCEDASHQVSAQSNI